MQLFLSKMIERKIILDKALRNGLTLSCVSIVYMLLSNLLTKIPNIILANSVSMVLWGVKFCLCIGLLRKFMKALMLEQKECERGDIYRLGLYTSSCSALIIAAFNLAYIKWITPNAFREALDVLKESGNMLPPGTISQVEAMLPNMPAIAFVSMLIYCIILGIIFSAIISRTLISDNPFKDSQDEEEW